MSLISPYRAGYIAIVGRPNVGKSTLLNHLVKRKISITSSKPQTTRFSIMGIVTETHAQYLFVDTPGFQTEHANAMNRAMNRVVTSSLSGVDVVVLVIEALKFDARDKKLVRLLPENVPTVLVINKIDQVADKSLLLPFMKEVMEKFAFAAIIPVSAEKGIQIDQILKVITEYLPKQPAIFEHGEVTDRSDEFMVAELIREKLFRLLGEELPYSTTVVIERFVKEGEMLRIRATIFVDRAGQKAIVIGKNGTKLKTIATQARKEMEGLLGCKVFLETWVKVKKGWTDDVAVIRRLRLTG